MFQSYRLELVKTALSGILVNSQITEAAKKSALDSGDTMQEVVAQWSVEIADAVIQKMEPEQEDKEVIAQWAAKLAQATINEHEPEENKD